MLRLFRKRTEQRHLIDRLKAPCFQNILQVATRVLCVAANAHFCASLNCTIAQLQNCTSAFKYICTFTLMACRIRPLAFLQERKSVDGQRRKRGGELPSLSLRRAKPCLRAGRRRPATAARAGAAPCRSSSPLARFSRSRAFRDILTFLPRSQDVFSTQTCSSVLSVPLLTS